SAQADVIHATETYRPRAIVERTCPEARRCPGDQSTVVAPVEAKPRATLPRLILQVGRLVELLIVVNAEGQSGSGRHRRARSANLRLEKARRHAREDHKGREAMDFRHAQAACISRNFRIVPFNRESDGSVAEHAEVVAIMRVLGDPFPRKDEILSEGLFDAGMEFIAKAGIQCSACSGSAKEERR